MMHVWALNLFLQELVKEKEAAGGHSATASGWGFLRPHFARAYPFSFSQVLGAAADPG